VHFRVLLPALTLVLSACGGGGGSEPAAPTQFLVSTQAGVNGTVSPVNAKVNAGQSVSFTITPAAEHQIGTVSGCDGRLNGQTYTTAAITANCTVSATFVTKRFLITTSTSRGGSITPASQTIEKGKTATFTLQPAAGFAVGSVKGCNGKLEGLTYTTGSVSADCNVEATFNERSWNVAVNVGAGGKASVATQSVKAGTVLSVNFIPDAGFELTDASGCGGTLRDLTLQTAPIASDCTIEAKFHPNNLVVLADAKLASVVRTALNLAPTADITKAQAATLQRLVASNAGISSIQGLQHFTGLKTLNLANNDITSIYPLQSLKALEELWLRANKKVTELQPLTGLTKLKRLYLASVAATDLSPLQALPLQTLELEQKAVLDLSPLRQMPLQQFTLRNSQTTDVSALASAPLRQLTLTGSKVNSISMLSNLAGLQTLTADGSDLVDISVLKQATALQSLNLSRTKVIDIATLASLNYSPNASLSISGCLDVRGYSRHIPQLNDLQTTKKITVQSNGGSRSDCADTLGGVTLVANGNVINRQLNYSIQVSGNTNPLMCAVYLDLDDQLPNYQTATWQDCSVSMNKILPGITADQFRVSLLFDNGIGGEKLVKFDAGAAPASPQLQSMDLNQITLSNRALLTAGRDGLLRLHVTAAQTPTNLPQVTVQASLNGNRQSFTAKAPPRLPTSKVHRSLTDSYQLLIPASWMQAGLELTAYVNGTVAQTLKPSFAPSRPLAIRIVPFQLGEKVATLPSTQQVETWVKNFWPFSEVTVRTRAPYVLKASGTTTTAYAMLAELSDLRRIEGESVYYYGYFAPEMGDGCCGGLGYVSFPVAVGFDTDRDGAILAHELGHNFGRNHVDCGTPDNPDRNYPYAANSTGSVGLSPDLSTLRLPEQYKDVMSYCSPKHVSDYNVEAVQEFVKQFPPPAFASTAAAAIEGDIASDIAGDIEVDITGAAQAGRTLYISGSIRDGALFIRTMLPLNRAAHMPVGSNPTGLTQTTDGALGMAPEHLIAKVQGSNGQWAQFPAQLLQIDHAADGVDFMLEIPYQNVIGLQLWQGGRLLAAQSATPTMPAPAAAHFSSAVDLAAMININEASNEVCVRWPAKGDQQLSVLHQVAPSIDSSGLTTLALNETSAEFCRPVIDLPSGGQWRIIWRDQLQVREFIQRR
jgi:Leucine-rich repeat (LRR) protein